MEAKGLDTYWIKGKSKVTLNELLEIIGYVPIKIINIKKLKPFLLDTIKDKKGYDRTMNSNTKIPILIVANEDGTIRYILDGHHRINKTILVKKKLY